MALTSLTTKVLGYCYVNIKIGHQSYPSVRLGVLKDLCSDIILGQDFQKKHKSVVIEYGGKNLNSKSPTQRQCVPSRKLLLRNHPFLQISSQDANQSQVRHVSSARRTKNSCINKLTAYSPKALLNLAPPCGGLKLSSQKTHYSAIRNACTLIIHR